MVQEFPAYKKSLIAQGRAFCSVTAPQCREKIATLAVDFLVDDCTASRPSSPRSTVAHSQRFPLFLAHTLTDRSSRIATRERSSKRSFAHTNSTNVSKSTSQRPDRTVSGRFDQVDRGFKTNGKAAHARRVDRRGDPLRRRPRQCRGVHHGTRGHGPGRQRSRRRIGREFPDPP